jgi:hypothetical protein
LQFLHGWDAFDDERKAEDEPLTININLGIKMKNHAIGALTISTVGIGSWLAADDARLLVIFGVMAFGFVLNPLFILACNWYLRLTHCGQPDGSSRSHWRLVRFEIRRKSWSWLLGLALPSLAHAILPVVIALAIVAGAGGWAALKIWSKALEIKQRQNAKPEAQGDGCGGGGGGAAAEEREVTRSPMVSTPSTPPQIDSVQAEVGMRGHELAIQFSVPAGSVLEVSTNLRDWYPVCRGGDDGAVAIEACGLPQAFYRLR